VSSKQGEIKMTKKMTKKVEYKTVTLPDGTVRTLPVRTETRSVDGTMIRR
jgi:hypothetical protein